MKKVIIILLTAVLLLTGCSSEPEVREPYTVNQDGVSLTIDPQRRAISHGETLYTYTASENCVSIYYPNGAVYSQRYSDQSGNMIIMMSGGWTSGSAEQILEAEQLYLDGDTLIDAAAREKPEPPKDIPFGLILMALVLIGGGVLTIIYAEQFAYWRAARWIKDAEPSDYAIYANTIGGAVMVGVGLIMLLIALLGV